jgi:hypothetical protein
MLSRVVLALALAAGADASAPKIAGYAPGSNVIPHNRIDLSAKAIMNLFKEGDDKTVHSTVTLDQARAVAYDMYNNGAGKSSNYVQYTTSAEASADMSNSAKTFTCKQDTDATGTAGDLMIGKLGHKSAVSKASGTKLKVYMDQMEGVPCGDVPFTDATETPAAAVKADGTGSYGNSAALWNADPWSASKGTYRQKSCPTFNGGDLKYSGKVICTSTGSNPVGESITYTMSDNTAKYGSRNLKGFSTAVEAKMISGPAIPEFEALSVKAYHGIGSYGDIHIQAAFAALKTGSTNFLAAGFSKFSSCTGCSAGAAPCQKDAVTDASACAAASGSWSQGTALCKSTKTNENYVNLGGDDVLSTVNTYTADVAKCVTNRKVTDFQIYSGPNEDVMLIEIIQKMAVYTNAWLYAVHEFEDAINDCVGSDITNNDAGVHAWDEGVAFYTGTLAGEESLQNGGSNGAMIYALANKRCKNYKTCIGQSATGQSQVNLDLFPLFTEGMLACNLGECGKARITLDKIIPKMSIPLIQGTLRYAYKVAVTNGEAKEFGEGTAFMMSIIHRVGACSKADARVIYDALDVPTTAPATAADWALGGGLADGLTGFTAVKEAFERNYDCMGVTCADIGSLQSGTTVYFEGCKDPVPPPSTATETEVLPSWALAAIAVSGVLMLVFFGMMCVYKASKDKTTQMYNDLKNGGGAAGKI